jgi:large conductance mechanosensitive channel
MLKEFQEFIARGSVIDLAVGVVVGAAFTAIVNSLVSDILMPPLGLILGGIDFSNFFITLKGTGGYPSLDAAKAAGAVTLNYGQFVNAVIRFLIVAYAIFILVKQVNRLYRKPAAPPSPAAPPQQEVLLGEIRDILKQSAR